MKPRCSVVIRDATAGDAAAMAGIKVDTWQFAYRGIIAADLLGHLSCAETAERFSNVISVPGPGEQFMVAENSGSVIGFIIFGPERAVAARDRGEVYAIYVRPEHHRKGVGRTLMQAAVNRMAGQGIRSLTVWTLEKASSRYFYQSLGGRLAGSKMAHIGDRGYVHIAYCWSDISVLAGY